MAKWDSDIFGFSTLPESSSTIVSRSVRIEYFCKHNAQVIGHGNNMTHLLVSVSWFKYYPKMKTSESQQLCGSVTFLNLLVYMTFCRSRLCKVDQFSLVDKLDGESVLFVCP